MKRRDFIKKLLLLPAIFVAPDVLGRIIPGKISGFKLKPFTTKDTLSTPVRNITTIRDNVAESIDGNYLAVMHPDRAEDFLTESNLIPLDGYSPDITKSTHSYANFLNRKWLKRIGGLEKYKKIKYKL